MYLQNTNNNLQKSFESEILEARKKQNMQRFTEVFSFLNSFIEKEKNLKDLEEAQKNIERN